MSSTLDLLLAKFHCLGQNFVLPQGGGQEQRFENGDSGRLGELAADLIPAKSFPLFKSTTAPAAGVACVVREEKAACGLNSALAFKSNKSEAESRMNCVVRSEKV